LTPAMGAGATRRASLAGGLAALALGGRAVARAENATPAAGAGTGLFLVQGFSHGTLFPTQGSDTNLAPYTLILWDAADAGLFFVDHENGDAGVIPTERILGAIKPAPAAPSAALIAGAGEGTPATGQQEAIWPLQLVLGNLGSDLGAVT